MSLFATLRVSKTTKESFRKEWSGFVNRKVLETAVIEGSLGSEKKTSSRNREKVVDVAK